MLGILTAGGAVDCLIEGNFIQNTRGAGINVGFYSELEWMEPASNPALYTSINKTVENLNGASTDLRELLQDLKKNPKRYVKLSLF